MNRTLLLSILTVLLTAAALHPLSAGNLTAATASIQATASVIYPIGISPVGNDVDYQNDTRSVPPPEWLCAPENRSILMITQTANQKVSDCRLVGGPMDLSTELIQQTLTPIDSNPTHEIVLTILDPDV